MSERARVRVHLVSVKALTLTDAKVLFATAQPQQLPFLLMLANVSMTDFLRVSRLDKQFHSVSPTLERVSVL